MTCATFAKSGEFDSCCTSDATTRMSYGDNFRACAVSSSPDCAYTTAPALIRFVRISWAGADGSTLKVPGAISPSIRR